MNKIGKLFKTWLIMILMIASSDVCAWCEDPNGIALTTDDLDWIDCFGYVLYEGKGFLWSGSMNKQCLEIPVKDTKGGKIYIVEQICPCVFQE